MKINCHVCANATSTDAQSNQITLFQILEQINIPLFPLVFPAFSVVTIAAREKGDRQKHRVSILLKLNNEILVDLPFEIDFQGGPRIRHTAEIRGLMIPGPGILHVELRSKNSVLSSWPIEIVDTGHATLEKATSTPSKPTIKKKKKPKNLK